MAASPNPRLRPLSIAALGVAFCCGCLPLSADLVNRWSFNEAAGSAPAGTSMTDSVSSAPAVVRGQGATFSGNAIVLPGTTIGNQTEAAVSAYINLPNGLISGKTHLTVEIWAAPLSSKNWQRVFDFGCGNVGDGVGEPGEWTGTLTTAPGNVTASDEFALTFNVANDLNAQRVYGRLDYDINGNANYVQSALGTAAGQTYHYVVTFEEGAGIHGASGGRQSWYRNGSLVGSQDLPYHLSAVNDVNNWIGRSQFAADSLANASYDEFRIYDHVLGQSEIDANIAAGPDTVVLPPPPVAADDSATLHAGQKVLVDVLANDSGGPVSSGPEVVDPPSSGTATVSNGRILYVHDGSGTAPDSFTYRVGGIGGDSNTATVDVTVSTALRIANPELAMPAAPPVTSWQLADALPGLTFARPICLVGVPGDTQQLYVCEQGGLIKRVDDVTALSPSTNVFLNLSAAVTGFTVGPLLAGQPENGLLGMAFHPDYASNGYFYVAYTVNLSGNYFQRVARFSRDAVDPTIADPGSQLILLDIDDFGLNHNGGDLHFGPFDGYLYYGTGDGENSTAGQARSQKLNGDFYSGIFRMDVDKRPGSLPPNPHASIPTDAGVARFNVPPDNPFVHTSLGGTWDGSYNGVSYVGSLGSVRTEYWATGIRHAWRMSFDPLTGDLWEGDVGQSTYEEVNKIVKGGNYGWAWREGAHDFNTTVIGTRPVGWTSIDPIYDYVHNGVAGGDANYKGNSVCGGHVYRGNRYPELYGDYIFCDSVSGHVWQMDTSTGATTRITGLPGQYGVFSAMGVDPSNQDILFCAYLAGKVMRLNKGGDLPSEFPQTLSETGLFADLSDLSPAPGLLPVEANLKFWSDFADKRRWFAIPDAGGTMTWNAEGSWVYPTGMLWVKHFDLALSRDDPATHKRIETRVLVKTDTGVYGVSYRWNHEETEAFLVEDGGAEFDLEIDDHGTPHTQHWQIPGRSSCLTCHGDRPLSFTTRQLNRVETMNGFNGNQIDLLDAGGFLGNTPDPVATLPFHVRPDETQYSLEQRARSYFDVNCAYCHQDGGSVSGFWDGREQLTLEQTGLIHGVPVQDGGDPANRYIVPGDTAHSIVLSRMGATNGFGRMPPLATSEVDPENLQLITEWITNELPNRPLYDEWAAGYSAMAGFPIGDRTDDPDGDGIDNYNEYLRGSSPLTGDGAWQAEASNDGGLALGFLRKAHRIYRIDVSDDLEHWARWDVPGNHSGYSATDEWTEIPFITAPGSKSFFRFEVSEP